MFGVIVHTEVQSYRKIQRAVILLSMEISYDVLVFAYFKGPYSLQPY